MSDVLTPGTPVVCSAHDSRGVVLWTTRDGDVFVVWDDDCSYTCDPNCLAVDPDGPVFDWVRPPTPDGRTEILVDDVFVDMFREVDASIVESIDDEGRKYSRVTVLDHAKIVDAYRQLAENVLELNPSLRPVVIKPGDWVTSTTHGHGLVLAGDRLHTYQVIHKNIDELYVEQYAGDELSADGVRQPWADSVLALLGEGVEQ